MSSMYRPAGLLDILQLPLIGRFLRWRRGRLVLQLGMLLVAAALVIDGLTGPQSAARNLATVAPWVHYRGLIVLVLLMVGNLFCMACPFALPRSLGKRLSRGRQFPRVAAQQVAGHSQPLHALPALRMAGPLGQPVADGLAHPGLLPRLLPA